MIFVKQKFGLWGSSPLDAFSPSLPEGAALAKAAKIRDMNRVGRS